MTDLSQLQSLYKQNGLDPFKVYKGSSPDQNYLYIPGAGNAAGKYFNADQKTLSTLDPGHLQDAGAYQWTAPGGISQRAFDDPVMGGFSNGNFSVTQGTPGVDYLANFAGQLNSQNQQNQEAARSSNLNAYIDKYRGTNQNAEIPAELDPTGQYTIFNGAFVKKDQIPNLQGATNDGHGNLQGAPISPASFPAGSPGASLYSQIQNGTVSNQPTGVPQTVGPTGAQPGTPPSLTGSTLGASPTGPSPAPTGGGTGPQGQGVFQIARDNNSNFFTVDAQGNRTPLTLDQFHGYGINEQFVTPGSTVSLEQARTGQSTPASPSGTPGGTPSVPPPAGTPSTPASLLGDVMQKSQITPEEMSAQQQLDNILNSKNLGIENVREQPVAMPFISGQSAAIERQAALQAEPLNQKLARLQAQRLASLDASKFALDAMKPTSLAYGAQLVNPLTGQTTNPGLFGNGATGGAGAGINPATGLTPNSTSADIMGYLSRNGINIDRYDAPGLLNAVMNGATAQDIIQGKANVAAANAGATQPNQRLIQPDGTYQLMPAPGVAGVNGGTGTPAPGNIVKPSNIGGRVSSDNPTGAYADAQGSIYSAQGQKLTLEQTKTMGPNGGPLNLDNLVNAARAKLGGGSNIGGATKPASLGAGASSGNSGGTSGLLGGPSNPIQIPSGSTKPAVTYKTDLTSGGVADQVNAINTSIGHLFDSDLIFQALKNGAVPLGNNIGNYAKTQTGQAAVKNYIQAQSLVGDEIANAYGAGGVSDRIKQSANGSPVDSPDQHKGFIDTTTQFLSSKIAANVQSYRNAFGTNPQALDVFVSPTTQVKLAAMGVNVAGIANGLAPSPYAQYLMDNAHRTADGSVYIPDGKGGFQKLQ